MSPGGPLVSVVNKRLADPEFCARVRTMHASQMPLLEMVEALDLGAELNDAVRDIVAQLAPDVVEAIRQATLEMLDTATRQMPLDCNVSQKDIDGGTPVDVSVVDEGPQPTILIRAR